MERLLRIADHAAGCPKRWLQGEWEVQRIDRDERPWACFCGLSDTIDAARSELAALRAEVERVTKLYLTVSTRNRELLDQLDARLAIIQAHERAARSPEAGT